MEVKAYIAMELEDLGRGLSRYLQGLTDEELSGPRLPCLRCPQRGPAGVGHA